MAESDHDPLTSESGIRKFFRGILPHCPHSSPQGGATPVHSEATETGNDEVHYKDNSILKRKSPQIVDNELDDSDYEENLPSCKRQRITVSAMSRLFAEFSLRDKEKDETPTKPNNEDDGYISKSCAKKDEESVTSTQKSQHNITSCDTPEHTTKTEKNNNNDEDIPNMNNKSAGQKRVKCKNKSSDLKDTPEGKRQKTEGKGEEILKKCDTSEETVKTNKRQVELNDSEAEENEEHANKVKRTRRLRRGLRLCTNITCYIEQVLYN